MDIFEKAMRHIYLVSSDKQSRSQFLKYIVVGGTAFAVEYISFLLLPHYDSKSLLMAQTLSFSAGLVVSFLGNRAFTFKNVAAYRHSPRAQFLRYVLLALANLILTNLIIAVLVSIGLPAPLAKLVVMGLVVSWNFIIFQSFIFKAD